MLGNSETRKRALRVEGRFTAEAVNGLELEVQRKDEEYGEIYRQMPPLDRQSSEIKAQIAALQAQLKEIDKERARVKALLDANRNEFDRVSMDHHFSEQLRKELSLEEKLLTLQQIYDDLDKERLEIEERIKPGSQDFAQRMPDHDDDRLEELQNELSELSKIAGNVLQEHAAEEFDLEDLQARFSIIPRDLHIDRSIHSRWEIDKELEGASAFCQRSHEPNSDDDLPPQASRRPDSLGSGSPFNREAKRLRHDESLIRPTMPGGF